MISDPATGVKDLLETAGVGIFAAQNGWGIFLGIEPREAIKSITIYNTGGRDPDPRFLVQQPSVQVRVKGPVNGYVETRDKIAECQDELLGLPSQALNGDNWDGITAIGDIQNLRYDESDRPIFVANFSLIIEPGTGTYRTSL